MTKSITQDMAYRQSLMVFAMKYGVSRASRKYNKSRSAIDEYSRLRFLGAYAEQSTDSSADFLLKLVAWYRRRGIVVECVQTDNGFEFTNRFSNSNGNKKSDSVYYLNNESNINNPSQIP